MINKIKGLFVKRHEVAAQAVPYKGAVITLVGSENDPDIFDVAKFHLGVEWLHQVSSFWEHDITSCPEVQEKVLTAPVVVRIETDSIVRVYVKR